MYVLAQIGSEPGIGSFSGYCESRHGFNQNTSATGDIHSQTLGNENPVQECKCRLDQECKTSGWDRSFQDGGAVIEIEPAQDGFAQASGADEGGQRRRAYIDYRAGFDAGKDRARGQRQ